MTINNSSIGRAADRSADPAMDSLAREIDGAVKTDAIHLSLFATDGSIFQVTPRCVVQPKSARDVATTVQFAREHGLTIHPRGAGSGLCGAALGPGIVLDFTRFMNRLVSIDGEKKEFTCEPGYRLGELEAALRNTNLFFPPDPSSGEYATFGGMFGTNASGAHSVKYGNVADYLVDAEMILTDGSHIRLSEISAPNVEALPPLFRQVAELYTRNKDKIETAYPDTRFNTAGYNLRGLVEDGHLHLERLFTGAEGTLGVAVRLTFRLVEKPSHDSLLVAYMDNIVSSAKVVQRVLPMGPSGIEIMDKTLLRLAAREDPALARALPEGVDNVLLVEFDGFDESRVAESARTVERMLREAGFTKRVHIALNPSEKKGFWSVRKAAVPILYRLKGKKRILALIEDAAVPIHQLVSYFEGVYGMLKRHGVRFVVYGHIAKGLLHTRPLLDLRDAHDVSLLKTLADEFYDLVSGIGGSISGEHGDGRLRSPYIKRSYPDIYHIFLEVKRIFDPEGVLNPEIITHHDPDQMKKALRFGQDYRRGGAFGEQKIHWNHGIADAVEICHGCGKCTTVTTATRMCPVFKETREEAASPRAKANVLRALIGGPLKDRQVWEKAVQSVTDWCILCESCKRECPSNVDIPKMIWEARARYVAKFGPSLHARIVTQPEQVGRRMKKISRVATPIIAHPAVRRLGERLTGVSAKRPGVSVANRSLFDTLVPSPKPVGRPVLYFSGCYAGYMRPEIGRAAVKLLTLAGYAVQIPPQHCCGLPMIAKGMTSAARQQIRRNLNSWADLLKKADALVVSCSSCGLALLEAWADMLGERAMAPIREKVKHISRLLLPAISGWRFRSTACTIYYHLPCHFKNQPDAGSSLILLEKSAALTVKTKETGCCGMAGAWGLHSANDALSRRIGSGLMEALGQSGATIAVTDCPTCRMQMEYLGALPVRHPVEIVAERLADVR